MPRASLTWSILGVGRAGGARARAIAADPRSVAHVGWRGDPAAAGLTPAPNLGYALARVDAVAVCAPDAAHPELVEAALRAGRHVVCEYPLASTVAEARRLKALAVERGLVLHVEHIELLGVPARWWRANPPGPIRGGRVTFTSARADSSPILGNLARLHRLLDIVGPPQGIEVQVRTERSLRASLSYGAAKVALEFRFGDGLARKTTLGLTTDQGDILQEDGQIFMGLVSKTLPRSEGLFAADQRNATAQILDGKRSYVSWDRILLGLALVEALGSAPLGEPAPFTAPT